MLLIIGILLLAGCRSKEDNVYGAGILVTGLDPTSTEAISPTQEPIIHNDPQIPLQVEPKATTNPVNWKELPVLPEISSRVGEIYAHGLSMGNNPRAFAKVGDCGSSISWFLGPFDDGPNQYNLGDYSYLQPTIEYFSGSFSRDSIAAQNGFTAASVFAPLWSDQTQCYPGEAPIACEYRILKPSFAFILLGTNDRWHMDAFEDDMRQIIEYSIEQGVIPILGTKADNFEGDESINRTIANLAMEYEVPLWNFWHAVQPLPKQGLEKDGAHLTWGSVKFDDPQNLQLGWPVRNLTALQTLDLVWRAAEGVNE